MKWPPTRYQERTYRNALRQEGCPCSPNDFNLGHDLTDVWCNGCGAQITVKEETKMKPKAKSRSKSADKKKQAGKYVAIVYDEYDQVIGYTDRHISTEKAFYQAKQSIQKRNLGPSKIQVMEFVEEYTLTEAWVKTTHYGEEEPSKAAKKLFKKLIDGE